MKKAVVLFSGGVDSTTCLALAIDKFGVDNVIALTLSYGQKHEKEILAAQKIINHYHVSSEELDVAKIFAGSNCSLLRHSNEEIPHGSYEQQQQQAGAHPVSTYVPFRNGLFLSIAASIGLSHGCSYIYYGAHRDDAAGNAYPDCSEAFHQAMNTAIFEGSGQEISIVAPFISKTKEEVVRTGLSLHVPYELTWSCYEGNETPCGTCGTCIDRMHAFEANGITDPLLSKD